MSPSQVPEIGNSIVITVKEETLNKEPSIDTSQCQSSSSAQTPETLDSSTTTMDAYSDVPQIPTVAVAANNVEEPLSADNDGQGYQSSGSYQGPVLPYQLDQPLTTVSNVHFGWLFCEIVENNSQDLDVTMMEKTKQKSSSEGKIKLFKKFFYF